MEYRELGPDEVIEIGDTIELSDGRPMSISDNWIGKRAIKVHSQVYRPIANDKPSEPPTQNFAPTHGGLPLSDWKPQVTGIGDAKLLEEIRERTFPTSTQVGGDHYTKLAIQPMTYSMENGLNPLQASVVKYITRYADKGGRQDLEKAKHCIDLLIEYEYGEGK